MTRSGNSAATVAIAEAVLPGSIIDTARTELRGRLETPDEKRQREYPQGDSNP